MTESNRIEFKRELTRELDIEKEVVAFLNYREGGIIYIGIDDSGKPVGVKDIDSDMLTIKNRLRDNILPSPMGLFDVTAEHIEGVLLGCLSHPVRRNHIIKSSMVFLPKAALRVLGFLTHGFREKKATQKKQFPPRKLVRKLSRKLSKRN